MSFTIRRPRAWIRQGQELERDSTLSFDEYLTFLGNNYGLGLGVAQTLTGTQEKVDSGYTGFAFGALKQCTPVFACELVRLAHFSEARFAFRQLNNNRPGKLYGTPALGRLEAPWPGGTTGDLLTRMLLHADLGGNAFVRLRDDGLGLLRPDWTTIVAGSPREGASMWDPDAVVVGYIYQPGGPGSKEEPVTYLAEEVAHFAPIPDPLAAWRGMSWLTPVITEIEGDRATATHKVKFLENGATPNMVIGLDMVDPDKFRAWVDVFRENYEGAANAYKTMFLGAGADPKVVGTDFKELDFKATQGAGETRIAAAAGTPPVLVGLSEGLQGSSLNEGNYTSARRRFADGTIRPLWRNASGSLARIIPPPSGSELWYDDRDIPFLKDDVKDAATILQAKAASIRQLVDAGFTPDSVTAAVDAQDLALLVHSGMLSVQLQEPGATTPPAPIDNGQPALTQ